MKSRLYSFCFVSRIDGALDPWISGMFGLLDELYPTDISASISNRDIQIEDSLPPPRIKDITDVSRADKPRRKTSYDTSSVEIATGSNYHSATVRRNDRITDPSWYQDVRHLEFDFRDDITCVTFISAHASSTLIGRSYF